MNPTEALIAIGAAAGALLTIGAAVRAGWRVSARIHRLADALLGDRDQGRPGVVERLDQIERRVARVELQVNPNGGASMHDKVTQIANVVTGADQP